MVNVQREINPVSTVKNPKTMDELIDELKNRPNVEVTVISDRKSAKVLKDLPNFTIKAPTTENFAETINDYLSAGSKDQQTERYVLTISEEKFDGKDGEDAKELLKAIAQVVHLGRSLNVYVYSMVELPVVI